MAKGLNVFHPGQVAPDNEHDDMSSPSRDPKTNEEPNIEAGIDCIESHTQTPVEDVDQGEVLSMGLARDCEGICGECGVKYYAVVCGGG